MGAVLPQVPRAAVECRQGGRSQAVVPGGAPAVESLEPGAPVGPRPPRLTSAAQRLGSRVAVAKRSATATDRLRSDSATVGSRSAVGPPRRFTPAAEKEKRAGRPGVTRAVIRESPAPSRAFGPGAARRMQAQRARSSTASRAPCEGRRGQRRVAPGDSVERRLPAIRA